MESNAKQKYILIRKRPPKLGQHFLKDHRVLERIVSVLELTERDTVIEVGPGHGELTKHILKKNPRKLIAIEKDGSLIDEYLIPLTQENKNLEIVHGDVLKDLDPTVKNSRLDSGKYKLVGNIPYYVTGHLLRVVSGLDIKPDVIVFTIQKEVAERLTATPPKMNLLAASVGFWGTPEIIRYVSRKSFRPAPKVSSAIIKITPTDETHTKEEIVSYYKFIKTLFRQPRKTVLNNIRDELNLERVQVEEILNNLGVNPGVRPQNINLKTIKKMTPLFTRQEGLETI